MIEDIFSILDEDFKEWPISVAGPANETHIDEIEKFAGFELPEFYKDFMRRYGAAMVGAYPVYGFGAAEVMGSSEDSVITVTAHFRQDDWPGSSDSLVISADGRGNAILLKPDGRIEMWDHDVGDTQILAPDLEHYVLELCRPREE